MNYLTLNSQSKYKNNLKWYFEDISALRKTTAPIAKLQKGVK